MRRLFLVFGSLTACLLLSLTLAYACGDKLLALHRGLRSQDFSSLHHASILMYTHMGSRNSDADHSGYLQTMLVKAGPHLETVDEQGRLNDALKIGHYDLVLVDLTDAPLVEESLRAAPSPPLVVVVYEGTKTENKLAKKQYRFLLKAPDKNERCLNEIERALDEKAKRDRIALRANK